MASGMTVAVVGATGAAGQATLRILEERKFPVRELRVFASERSVGKTVPFRGEPVRVQKIEPGAFKGVQIAFCSAGSVQSKAYAPMLVQAGAVVIDKSSAFRMDPNVPLVVPEINAHAARNHQGILACPNCTTIVTVMPLKPLHDGPPAPRDRRELPIGVGRRRQRDRRAQGADARLGARGDHPAQTLPASDRLQSDPGDRPVRARRVHG